MAHVTVPPVPEEALTVKELLLIVLMVILALCVLALILLPALIDLVVTGRLLCLRHPRRPAVAAGRRSAA